MNEVRYCKKCRCELMSNNKHKMCDDCRRKRNKKIRDGIVGTGKALGSVAAVLYFFKGKNGDGSGKS